MAKGYRTPIGNSMKSRTTDKLGSVFVDVRGPKSTRLFFGKIYVTTVSDDFTRYS